MAILKIARMGHPVLRQVAAPVEALTADVVRLIDDMIETMADAEGIGLAAPQVHRSERVIVFLDVERRDQASAARPNVLINPEIVPLGEDVALGLEGCLSMPGLRGLVPRHARIRYRGLDREGQPVQRDAEGLHARVVQHEVDHLDGILYPERMTDLRTLVFESELRHFMADVDEEPPA